MESHGVPVENFTFLSPWIFHWYETGNAVPQDLPKQFQNVLDLFQTVVSD